MFTAKQKTGVIYTISSAVLFGIVPVFARQAATTGSDGETVAFLSNSIACVLLFFYMKMAGISFSVTGKHLRHLIWIGCVGQGGTNILLYKAYLYIPIGMATMIHFLYPVMVYAELVLLFQQRPKLRELAGLCIAVTGMVVFMEKGAVSGLGMVMAFVSAITFSAYVVGIDKTPLKHMSAVVAAFYISVFSSITIGIYNYLSGSFDMGITMTGYLYAGAAALGGNVLAKIFLQKGIEKIGSDLAAVLSLLEPITSLIMGILIYREILSIRKIIGSCMVLGAIVVITKNRNPVPLITEKIK